jgi:hypothetical protein
MLWAQEKRSSTRTGKIYACIFIRYIYIFSSRPIFVVLVDASMNTREEKKEKNSNEQEHRRSLSNLEPTRIDKAKSLSSSNLLSLSLPSNSPTSPAPIEQEPAYPPSHSSVESSPILSSSSLLRATSQSQTSEDEGILPPLHAIRAGGGGGCPFMQVRKNSSVEVPTSMFPHLPLARIYKIKHILFTTLQICLQSQPVLTIPHS